MSIRDIVFSSSKLLEYLSIEYICVSKTMYHLPESIISPKYKVSVRTLRLYIGVRVLGG